MSILVTGGAAPNADPYPILTTTPMDRDYQPIPTASTACYSAGYGSGPGCTPPPRQGCYGSGPGCTPHPSSSPASPFASPTASPTASLVVPPVPGAPTSLAATGISIPVLLAVVLGLVGVGIALRRAGRCRRVRSATPGS